MQSGLFGSAGPTEPPLLAYRFEWGGLLRVKILNPPTLNWMNHLQSMVTEYLHGIKV